MESYNSREIGVKLYDAFIHLLDDDYGYETFYNNKPPKFIEPKMVGAIILDGF